MRRNYNAEGENEGDRTILRPNYDAEGEKNAEIMTPKAKNEGGRTFCDEITTSKAKKTQILRLHNSSHTYRWELIFIPIDSP